MQKLTISRDELICHKKYFYENVVDNLNQMKEKYKKGALVSRKQWKFLSLCLYYKKQLAIGKPYQLRKIQQIIGKKYADIFDLRSQWKTYLLFLMVPRACSLYCGYEKLPYLFPFPAAEKGSSIILYGAGAYGQRLYYYLEKTGFCSITAWVDRNYKELGRMGLLVESPEVIPGVSYDAIVIANTYERSRKALYQDLIGKYPKEKVHMPDVELIFSEESMKAFGLTENAG